MYSIGEFSKIGSVSTKTLRYYDEIGLLKPAYIDEENRYRYYSEAQVDTILFISELKTYDLRLEQIKAILEKEDSSLLEHFLRQRMEQLDEAIQGSIRLRRSIEQKVLEIQSGGRMMEQKFDLVVEAKEFTPVRVMSQTAAIEITQVGTVIGKVFEAIFKNGLKPSGPVMVFYLDKEFQPENANVEVCVPVADGDDIQNIDGVKMVNTGLCATCTYVGPYSKMGKAYAAVMKWIEENDYEVRYAPYDVYLNSPQEVQSPEELATQIWFPVQKKI